MWLEVKSNVAIVPAKRVKEVVEIIMCSRAVVRDSSFWFYEWLKTKNEQPFNAALLFQLP